MDSSPLALAKAFLPKVPLAGKTAVWHTLGLSENSHCWDLRTELTVSIMRSFIVDSPVITLSKMQRLTLKDPGIKGRIWVSKVTVPPPPEDSIRQALFSAIEALKPSGSTKGGFTEPEMLPVTAEWTGYRAGATKDSKELRISEEAKYKEMMKEVHSPVAVLYFHGGAYYAMDPATHRPTCKKLAKLTKGRVLNVRYRLAPQGPFPSALLDALVAYLWLLHPPPGAFHSAVKPSNIVFAGDSAGGNLSLALLQAILQLRRTSTKILWQGQEVEIPLPAGTALCSPWADITHSSPSCETNKKYDYLPPRSAHPSGMAFPPCDLWPHPPPRKNVYADDGLLSHPLVSPLAVEDWTGSPPLYIQTGEELLTDEDRYIASLASNQGVKVVFEEYEAMPHCFAMLLSELPASRLFFERWAGFMSSVAGEERKEVVSSAVLVKAKSLKEEAVALGRLVEWGGKEVKERMEERVRVMSGDQSDALSKL